MSMETESRSTPQHTDVPDAALFWRWAGRAGRPVVGWVLIGVGALAILVGYFGLADRVLVAEQLPYLISGGIGGMAFVVVGGVLLATQDVRRDAERLDQFEAALSVLQEKVDDLHRVLLHRPAERVRTVAAVTGSTSWAAARRSTPATAVCCGGSRE
ncbi:MAG: hypothetical protein E6G57_16265 [Actinobacteria bacterium]|nr:MAG: hypothetical protein E6G57_16265 [Actinomycetota bacterium]